VREFAERELLPEMRARHQGAGFEWQELMSYPALAAEPGSTFEALCRRLSGTKRAAKLSFGTEAGHFAARGVPAVVCGPGDIAVAHKPDEHVEVEQLERCATFLRGLVGEALAARA
jgi:acetylornithine deacetylase